MRSRPHSIALATALLASLVCFYFVSTRAQNAGPPTSAAADQKPEAIIKRAIEVLGGTSYLNVSTVIGRGFYSQFVDGLSQPPAKFIDYIVYPDKERTEFISGGLRVIQTNFGDQGWIFDGAAKTINDQKQNQIDDYKFGLKTGLEYFLRGTWRKDDAKLTYVGRREAGLAKRNEVVRLTFADGFWIEYEFGAKDGLPAKIIYMRKRKNPDNGELEEVIEEDHLLKYITVDGVNAPWVVDHFIAGKQSSRVNYESLEYNKPIADSIFTKPASIKMIK